jgi:DNA-binding response OmpR family regulator
MNAASERILLVGDDPDIDDLIARQALPQLGYQVKIAADVSTAILDAARFAPDLIIADLNLPGLSGKDLLVALNSQGMSTPVIVIAQKGEEQKVIQAFRLGASDYLLWPARETEVVAAVEHALKQVREGRARQRLDLQLQDSNEEIKQRMRELTTIFAVGKAVISITDQRILFDKIVEGIVYVAEADCGWLLLRDEQARIFRLAAHRNLPETWARKVGEPLEDGISTLVVLSGETLAINGEPLQRFKVAALGQSAVVIPVKIHQEVIGLLVVVRKADRPFDKNMQTLLQAVADYASISLVNARLFRAIQETAEAAQLGEETNREQYQTMRAEIERILQPMTYPLELLLAGKMGKLSREQQQAMNNLDQALHSALSLVTVDPQTLEPAGKNPKE